MDMSSLVEVKNNPKIPDIVPGDTVRVSARIVEGGKERIQVFQGVVIKMRRGGAGASFTVRHVAYGIGVERTFLLHSPVVEKVEIVRQGKVRRAKLYYLRELSGREARRKIKRVERKVRKLGEEIMEPEPEEEMEAVMESAAEQEVEAVPESEAVASTEQVREEAKEPAPVPEETSLEKGPEKEMVLDQAAEVVLKEKPEEAPLLEKEPDADTVVEPGEDQRPEKEAA